MLRLCLRNKNWRNRIKTQANASTKSKVHFQQKETSSFDRNNSYGKASLKQQKSPETTTDTQDASKCY